MACHKRELTEHGFRQVDEFTLGEGPHLELEYASRLKSNRGTYAIFFDDQVVYIGKSVSDLKAVFKNYRTGPEKVATRHRIHNEIKAHLAGGGKASLMLAHPEPVVRGDLIIHQEEAFEQALIIKFQPRLNKQGKRAY